MGSVLNGDSARLPLSTIRSFSTGRGKPQPTSSQLPIPVEVIERRIYLIRCQKVMLGSDLAKPYGVATSNLNKASRTSRYPQGLGPQSRAARRTATGPGYANRCHLRHGQEAHGPAGTPTPADRIHPRARGEPMLKSQRKKELGAVCGAER